MGLFSYRECENCGTLFIDPLPSPETIRTFYPPGYWWEEAPREKSLSYRLASAYRRWVIRDHMRFLKGLPHLGGYHGRLLDVGCGSGTFLCEARRVGYEVSGLDLSPEALGLLKARGIKAYAGSLSENSLGQQTFEVITLFHVLEHLADPLNDLRLLLRHLAPGGDLVIQVPNRSSMQARVLSRRWYGLDPPRHLTQFSRGGLIRLIQRAGLRPGRIFSFSLRDNAPAIVSSLFPGLDPKARSVRNRRAANRSNSLTEGGLFGLYFALVVLATPLALLEAAFAAGGTLCLRASKIAP